MAPLGLLAAALATMEKRAVETLLRSPMFHRGVQKIQKSIDEARHGKRPEDMGGTSLETPPKGEKSFVEIFWDELKTGHKPESKDKK